MPHRVRLCILVCLVVHASFSLTARAESAFPEGVGSGDVTSTSAILWTRTHSPGSVRVEVALEQDFAAPIIQAVQTTTAETDFTLRYDATGLEPATRYSYRFIFLNDGAHSPVGTFHTAPAADDPRSFRFVYSGDSAAELQPFTVLRHAADEQPDLWFWAGDTMYADVPFRDLPVARNLATYRAKYRQNREDAHLRDLLAKSPVWVQWDDHEVANDYDGGDLGPRISPQQQREAYQAFFEHMPIRPQNVDGDAFRIYRSIRYGALAEFFILDGRQYRSRSVERDGGGPDPRAFLLPTLEIDTIIRLADPSRTMLGAEQLAWLKEGLRSSTARWKFVLSSVPFTSLLFIPYDRWDGYVAERYDLLRFIDTEGIDGVVILSADIHGNVYNPDVTKFLRETIRQRFSPCFRVPEFIAGPIAADTLRQSLAIIGAAVVQAAPAEFESSLPFNVGYDFLSGMIIRANGLSFIDGDRFAYLVVDVEPDRLVVSHRGIPSDPTILDAPLETMFTVTLPEAVPPGCAPGLLTPICACLAIGLFAAVTIARRAAARRVKDD